MRNFLLLSILLCNTLLLSAQKRGEISGYVSSVEGGKLKNVIVLLEGNTTQSDSNGFYRLSFPYHQREYRVGFSLNGYRSLIREIEPNSLKSRLNVSLYPDTINLPGITVSDLASQNTYQTIDAALAGKMPNVTSSFETLLKMLPGVSSHNELSSQYAVRGGNFDGNLVYVNGMEVYRPFLVKSGMQEGLSFINPDMVGKALFSAGGFETKYGGKMSSVLAINYQQPNTNAVLASLSLIGGSLTVKRTNKSKNAGFLIGLRHKTNALLLNTLDTRGDYQPSFTDVQAYFEFRPTKKWQFYALANANINRFGLRPENRETSFGTSDNIMRLQVDFEGHETDRFDMGMLSLGTKFMPTESLLLNFYTSGFSFNESLKHDITGAYVFEDVLSGNPDSSQLKIGTHYQHANNNLRANLLNIGHRGKLILENNTLEWGFRWQYERFKENLDETSFTDAENIENPIENDEVFFPDTAKGRHRINGQRISAYLQNRFSFSALPLRITAGLRGSYWSQSKQVLLGPRVNISYPLPKLHAITYLSTGLYHQPIFYKELKMPNGMLSNNRDGQSSFHIIAGLKKQLPALGTSLSFSAELFYKYLYNVIPYRVDNLQIVYLPMQRTEAYAMGLDVGLKGELVAGLQSSLSLSLMQAAEKSTMHSGFLPRSTDQRFNLALFLQDRFLNDPSYKVHLNAILGSKLPTWAPNADRTAANTFRIPAYRRLDIGFSKTMKTRARNKLGLHSLIAYAEIFNLFDINNTVSYLWIKDTQNQQYAVPWYLTGRQINIKLIAKF